MSSKKLHIKDIQISTLKTFQYYGQNIVLHCLKVEVVEVKGSLNTLFFLNSLRRLLRIKS